MTVHRPVTLVLLIALTACASATTDTTSTLSTSTTSTTSTTSSTTSTIEPPTTSTAPPTTSTTAGAIEGNWGDQPLIAYSDWGGIALGWWDGSSWVQVEEGLALPVAGGEDYQVALLDSSAVVKGGPPASTGCDVVFPEGMPGIHFDDGNALYMTVDDGDGGERTVSGVAITAPWDLTPRPVTRGESHPDFVRLATILLEERGYEAGIVEIVQAVDADLDGDGAIETLFVAEETHLANEMSGVYSIVFAVSPSWGQPLVIEESVIPHDDTGFPASYRVSAVADLSGDGQMEVVLDGLAWENSWVAVYELTDAGFQARILAGCGV